MQFTILSLVLPALALAAPKYQHKVGSAILQFEIDEDTFTSDTEIAVPGTLNVNLQLIGATIAEVSGIANESSVACQALDANDNPIGTPFTLETFVTFDNENLVEVDTIECYDWAYALELSGLGWDGVGQFVFIVFNERRSGFHISDANARLVHKFERG